jgi:hypothetical protein
MTWDSKSMRYRYMNRFRYNWFEILQDARQSLLLKGGRDIATMNPDTWVSKAVRPRARDIGLDVVSATLGDYVLIQTYNPKSQVKPHLTQQLIKDLIKEDQQ